MTIETNYPRREIRHKSTCSRTLPLLVSSPGVAATQEPSRGRLPHSPRRLCPRAWRGVGPPAPAQGPRSWGAPPTRGTPPQVSLGARLASRTSLTPARRRIPALGAAPGASWTAAAREGAAESRDERASSPAAGPPCCLRRLPRRTAESRRREALPYGTVAKSGEGTACGGPCARPASDRLRGWTDGASGPRLLELTSSAASAGRPAAGSARRSAARTPEDVFPGRRGRAFGRARGDGGAAESQGVGGEARHGAGGTGERGRPRRDLPPRGRSWTIPVSRVRAGRARVPLLSPSARPAAERARLPSPAGHCEVRPAGASGVRARRPERPPRPVAAAATAGLPPAAPTRPSREG